ncbi:class I adenylate-forming enzyme family protein [Pseudooceanicola marinus]|uniref:class I adenylate-forming enzyme family protein n=1 Tax=Pseudooceanicola marinus TaxID=396013 RepID=UPI001CD6F6C2|nr:class I adenylate-forming enzyme family protein [Pseudooceanicola marinus]MCA1334335.1 acyl--CoA ligase [Pseudooceanicola marinus]
MTRLSICDRGPAAPCPAPFNMAAHVLAKGQATPDKVALAILGLGRAERWSYARLEAAVRGTATGLRQAGLVPGDVVLMRLGNTVEFPLAYLGAIAAGLVPVPSSAQLTAPEVARLIKITRPAAILLGDGVVCPETELPVLDQAALLAMRDLPAADYHMGDPDRPAYIVFTSGTSGTPRAVEHAHRAIWARQMMHAGWYGLGPDDRLLHAGAFNWTFTLGTGLMDPWTAGATALIPAEGVPLTSLPLLLKRHEATLFAAAPGVYRKLLSDHPTLPLPKLRHGLAAGEKLSDRIRDEWREATGLTIHEAFGMSEISTFLSGSPADPAAPGTLGRPQPGRRVAILGEDGAPVPLGEDGIIAVDRADPGLMRGYLNAPEATAARMSGDWFLTGDLGRMDEDGAITYRGRSGDMMNAGGYRVSPAEVEAALSDLPGVTEIAVTEIEVKQDASVIAAFYTGTEQDPLTLSSLAAQRLARYKQPRIWQHCDALPRNSNGKLQRPALRALWEKTP